MSPVPAPCPPPTVRADDGSSRRRSARSTVSVVIPAKNEAANIPWVLARVPSWVDEIIVVDGLSTDGTLEVARECVPDVIAVHEMRPGKGAAVRAGFTAARGEIIVMLDADGSMDPAEIDRFVRAIEDGADLAKGSRRLSGGGSADLTTLRDLGNRALLAIANTMFGVRFSELCYGYMAMRRSRVDELGLVADGFEIETEIVVRSVVSGLAVSEVPSFEAPRRAGASNLNVVRDGLRILATLVGVRFGLARPGPAATAVVPLAEDAVVADEVAAAD
jgi:glycosyltransferase involved in cell wall biosynthesis